MSRDTRSRCPETRHHHGRHDQSLFLASRSIGKWGVQAESPRAAFRRVCQAPRQLERPRRRSFDLRHRLSVASWPTWTRLDDPARLVRISRTTGAVSPRPTTNTARYVQWAALGPFEVRVGSLSGGITRAIRIAAMALGYRGALRVRCTWNPSTSMPVTRQLRRNSDGYDLFRRKSTSAHPGDPGFRRRWARSFCSSSAASPVSGRLAMNCPSCPSYSSDSAV